MLGAIWRPGFRYSKAGIMLAELVPAMVAPRQLFPTRDPATSARLMGAMDAVNAQFGRGTLRPLATGIAPVLSPVAAVGLAVLMAGAVVVHARRREPVVPPLALLVLALAAAVLGFVALG